MEGFLVDEAGASAAGAAPRGDEQLLVWEQAGTLEVGLFLSADLLRRLPDVGLGAEHFLGRSLSDFAAAAEGVSHFVYLTLQALHDRAVSLLELEVQAEVDKFAAGALHLWKHGGRARSAELRRRLFEGVAWRGHLADAERERYREANRLAHAYSGRLVPHVAAGALERLLGDLRCAYRLRGPEKFAWLAHGG